VPILSTSWYRGAGFEVPSEVLIKIRVFWDVTLPRLLNNDRPFGGVNYFHFLLELLDPEDDIKFLRIVHRYLPIWRAYNNKETRICFCLFVCFLSSRSQWPRGLRRRSTAARLLRSCVRIPLGAWTSVCCECFVLSGRGLCDEVTTRPEASCRLLCVAVCYRNLVNEEPNINQ
jgi:hypothetical protein